MAAQGTTTVNFGAFPGATDTTATVTGQAGIIAGSLVEAWIRPADTADHLADEHWVEDVVIVAGTIVAGTGFTIYARKGGGTGSYVPQPEVTPFVLAGPGTGTNQPRPLGGTDVNPDTRLYGLYTVAWVWN